MRSSDLVAAENWKEAQRWQKLAEERRAEIEELHRIMKQALSATLWVDSLRAAADGDTVAIKITGWHLRAMREARKALADARNKP